MQKLKALASVLRSPLAWAAITVLALRPALFGSGAAWNFYRHSLMSPHYTGWREADIMQHKVQEHLGYFDRGSIRFFSMGSSQTANLFDHQAFRDRGGLTFSIAGCGPLDLFLHREVLLRVRPRTLLLVQSEFDVATVPSLKMLPLTSAQGWDWLTVFPRVVRHRSLWKGEMALMIRTLLGEWVPEYRYAFVFRGWLNRLTERRRFFEGEDIAGLPEGQRQSRYREWIHAGGKPIADLNPRAIDFHLPFLEDLIAYCAAQGIEVLILEGQYQDFGDEENRAAVHEEIVKRLRELETRHRNLRFLSRENFYRFQDGDYVDSVHVTREAGLRYFQSVAWLFPEAEPEQDHGLGDFPPIHEGSHL